MGPAEQLSPNRMFDALSQARSDIQSARNEIERAKAHIAQESISVRYERLRTEIAHHQTAKQMLVTRNGQLESQLESLRVKHSQAINAGRAAKAAADGISHLKSMLAPSLHGRIDQFDVNMAHAIENLCANYAIRLNEAIDDVGAASVFEVDKVSAQCPCDDRKPTDETIKF